MPAGAAAAWCRAERSGAGWGARRLLPSICVGQRVPGVSPLSAAVSGGGLGEAGRAGGAGPGHPAEAAPGGVAPRSWLSSGRVGATCRGGPALAGECARAYGTAGLAPSDPPSHSMQQVLGSPGLERGLGGFLAVSAGLLSGLVAG